MKKLDYVGNVNIVSNPVSEEQCLLKSVYLTMLVTQIHYFLCKTEAGKTEWGIGKREREREREKERNRLRE